MQQEQLMPANGAQTAEDEEGSGADPQIAPAMADSVAPPSIAARVSWIWNNELAFESANKKRTKI